MKRLMESIMAVVTVFALTGCETMPASSVAADTAADHSAGVDVRQAMIDGVNPAALAIWDVGNNALDEDGQPDAGKLDRQTLARLREGAQMLDTYAVLLADAPLLKASGPDLIGGRLPEGVASREQIQAAIDANPAGFRAYARAMGVEAKAILAAIEAGDRATVATRVATFDGACQSCHERYWYVT